MVIKRAIYIFFSCVIVFHLGYIETALGAPNESRHRVSLGNNRMVSLRKASERGLSKNSWLVSRHTFSFAEYHDPKHTSFRSLRVINEDKIQGGSGFDSHPHQNMEIVSYVMEGALRHKDSMGNEMIIRPNEVQRMSAGTGVIHSEYNHEKNKETHLYQIWITPKNRGMQPSYAQKSFENELKKNKLTLVVSNTGREGSITIDQDVDIYISRLKQGEALEFKSKVNRYQWIQMVKGKMSVNGIEVSAGDGVSNEGTPLNFNSKENSEFIVFDLN